MIKAKVIGATGYGGVGIIELLLKHPEVELSALVAKAQVGRPLHEVYPHLVGFCEMPVLELDHEDAQKPADVVFFATPDGVAMELAGSELEKGAKVIDYSGDFRFNSVDDHADYALKIGRQGCHAASELLPEALYGVPEINRQEINEHARLVGNAGCFAVGCIIGLAPAVANQLVEPVSIICDCKSGVSGAGKKPQGPFHFPERQDQISAYRLSGHQHICEIEKALGGIGNTDIKITFTAQVVPANRGILSSLYGELAGPIKEDRLVGLYQDFYKDSPFVRVFNAEAADGSLGTLNVRGSNYCNLVVGTDERTNKLRIIAHIDNLMKGQAGNALQNMNLLFGFPETTGLDFPGQYP